MNISTQKSLLNQKCTVVFLPLLFLFLLLENPLEQIVPELRFFDEVAVITTIIIYFFMKRGFSEFLFKSIIGLIFFLLFVCIGNVVSGYQGSSIAIVKDIFAFCKVPIIFLLLREMPIRKESRQLVLVRCSLIAKVFVLITFAALLLTELFEIQTMGLDYRHSLLSFRFVYSHPTYLVFAMVLITAVLVAEDKKIDFFKIAALLIIVFTLRDKGFVFVAIVSFFMIIKIEERTKLWMWIVPAAVVVLIVAWPKLSLYLSFPSSQREILYSMAISIAGKFFPVGSGFATVACSLSGEYYSKAYYSYSVSDIIWMTPEDYTTFGDAGLAYYVGELGIIGFLLFVVFIIACIAVLLRAAPLGSNSRLCLFIILAYLALAIPTETVLTNPSGVMAMLTIFLFLGNDFSDASLGKIRGTSFYKELFRINN